ncbi:MAG: hypothetical protein KDK40_00155 [Chlamydiia bacterium]|nr:hypothetical protein [Chlamydiia bacterium]
MSFITNRPKTEYVIRAISQGALAEATTAAWKDSVRFIKEGRCDPNASTSRYSLNFDNKKVHIEYSLHFSNTFEKPDGDIETIASLPWKMGFSLNLEDKIHIGQFRSSIDTPFLNGYEDLVKAPHKFNLPTASVILNSTLKVVMNSVDQPKSNPLLKKINQKSLSDTSFEDGLNQTSLSKEDQNVISRLLSSTSNTYTSNIIKRLFKAKTSLQGDVKEIECSIKSESNQIEITQRMTIEDEKGIKHIWNVTHVLTRGTNGLELSESKISPSASGNILSILRELNENRESRSEERIGARKVLIDRGLLNPKGVIHSVAEKNANLSDEQVTAAFSEDPKSFSQNSELLANLRGLFRDDQVAVRDSTLGAIAAALIEKGFPVETLIDSGFTASELRLADVQAHRLFNRYPLESLQASGYPRDETTFFALKVEPELSRAFTKSLSSMGLPNPPLTLNEIQLNETGLNILRSGELEAVDTANYSLRRNAKDPLDDQSGCGDFAAPLEWQTTVNGEPKKVGLNAVIDMSGNKMTTSAEPGQKALKAAIQTIASSLNGQPLTEQKVRQALIRGIREFQHALEFMRTKDLDVQQATLNLHLTIPMANGSTLLVRVNTGDAGDFVKHPDGHIELLSKCTAGKGFSDSGGSWGGESQEDLTKALFGTECSFHVLLPGAVIIQGSDGLMDQINPETIGQLARATGMKPESFEKGSDLRAIIESNLSVILKNVPNNPKAISEALLIFVQNLPIVRRYSKYYELKGKIQSERTRRDPEMLVKSTGLLDDIQKMMKDPAEMFTSEQRTAFETLEAMKGDEVEVPQPVKDLLNDIYNRFGDQVPGKWDDFVDAARKT